MDIRPLAATALLLLSTATAWTQERETPNVAVNGFGTFGVVYSSENEADFVRDMFAAEGAGHSDRWSPKVDSIAGLQVTASLTPRISGIVQGVVEQSYDGAYKPALEWAYLAFEPVPDLHLRAGRILLPTFMTSEYRKVGYATPWLRPPQEVYRLVPVTNVDGVAARYVFRINDFTNTLHATFGLTDAKMPVIDETGSRDTMVTESRDGVTLSNTLERGAAALFASFTSARLTMEDFNPFFDAFRQFGPEGEAIADRYDVDGKRVDIYSIGARYDTGDWFLMGEWARLDSETFILNSRGWYITGGYRYRSVTPYLTIARTRIHSSTSHPGVSQPGSEELDAALNEILGGQPQQRSISVGLRWDFALNTALTLQYDYMDLDDESAGVLVNPQPGFRRGGNVSLFSAALDFVF